MNVVQGDIWWADLPPPRGSGPGVRRPVIIIQGNALNRSRIATIVCVPLTSNVRWAAAPGNVLLTRETSSWAGEAPVAPRSFARYSPAAPPSGRPARGRVRPEVRPRSRP
ncbi:MAG: type II toxin-antitoxin system PemK/MazF family toxin [Armatimonadota bacterium]|nr:type II toxin-antitoxin system PemK/MazF family toxin [Armatimonadota bacterium]MDR7452854.1 type II toxin-antitoxin system PemK/MazF family toxin [Armatimonadota bacterium]MDR7456166.1 type II toxin-antitoxin system PemK/MazF family toxin [Armatimonadota bacterium]